MDGSHEDILLDISDEDLPKLAEMYENHKDWAPNIHSMIMTALEWRKKRKEKYLKFMSPNGCWRNDGTFFVTVSHYCFSVLIASLADNADNIYQGILHSRRISTGNYVDRDAVLYAIHNKFYPTIVKGLKDTGLSITKEKPCFLYSISQKEANKFELNCPPEVYLRKLDSSHAELINSLWPHKYKNSEKFVAFIIEMNESCGVFLKSTDELVAWTLVSVMGELCFLQTLEGHQRKGYGSLPIKHLSKIIANKGENPCLTVLQENMAAIKMFEKIGFRNKGSCMFTLYK